MAVVGQARGASAVLGAVVHGILSVSCRNLGYDTSYVPAAGTCKAVYVSVYKQRIDRYCIMYTHIYVHMHIHTYSYHMGGWRECRRLYVEMCSGMCRYTGVCMLTYKRKREARQGCIDESRHVSIACILDFS